VRDEPYFFIDDNTIIRFTRFHAILSKLKDENDQNLEENSNNRRRYNLAISRFSDTFDKGLWESVVTDCVISMESLLVSIRAGGPLLLALVASNLLGTHTHESKEVFANIKRMYRIRNYSVHGDPLTKDTWEKILFEIAADAGFKADECQCGPREYAIEVIRDYTRRVITASLCLFDNEGLSPSEQLTYDLQSLHLDEKKRATIQSKAEIYPFRKRSIVRQLRRE